MASRVVQNHYVCWRCFRQPIFRLFHQASSWMNGEAESLTLVTKITNHAHGTVICGDEIPPSSTSIRQELLDWELRNKQHRVVINTPAMNEGGLSNLTRDKSVDEVEVKEDNDLNSLLGDELAQARANPLLPGTMIEKTFTGVIAPTLAVCVTRYGPYYVLCTERGQVSLELMPYSAFTLKGFMDPTRYERLVKALPSDLLEKYSENTLLDLPTPELVAHTGPIVHDLKEFGKDVDSIYRGFERKLDVILDCLADENKVTYRTLHELAQKTYGTNFRYPDGTYTGPALYSLHRSLISGDISAVPLVPPSALYTNVTYYEIPKSSDLKDIRSLDDQIKKYMNFKRNITMLANKEKTRIGYLRTGGTPLVEFIEKARNLIDRSRQRAPRDRDGRIMLGEAGPGLVPKWSEDDMRILNVIYMWAGYEKFSPRSRLNMLGSTVLRATERYGDIFSLSQSVGWTFLKEIGWIPPWEVRARYKTLPPGVGAIRGGGFSRETDTLDIAKSLKPDVWAGKRKKWNLTAFAIDSADTEFVDDAVSLEPAAAPGEFWIHVHVADPCSEIMPQSQAALHAETLPLTVWIPFHHTSMLPFEWVGPKFSLAKNNPCLTFSARLDKNGDIVETQVTPAILDKVLYMTPYEANRAAGLEQASRNSSPAFVVGTSTTKEKSTRILTTADALKPQDSKILQQLNRIAVQRKLLGLERGATPTSPPKAAVKGGFQPGSNIKGHWPDHPYIALRMDDTNNPSVDYSPLVHQTMLIGCEAAARWCAERRIPIPYLSHAIDPGNIDIIRKTLKEHIYPQLSNGQEQGSAVWRKLLSLLGWQRISTTPGPFVFHGQDMYAKVTSPLRRYSDMLCHWQIHRYLQLAEKSTNGKVNLSQLPFTTEQLDREVLPMLRVRERLITQASRVSEREIAVQALLRAWRLGEGSTLSSDSTSNTGSNAVTAALPETLRFTVQSYSAGRKMVTGTLNWFGIVANFGRDELPSLIEGVQDQQTTVEEHVVSAAKTGALSSVPTPEQKLPLELPNDGGGEQKEEEHELNRKNNEEEPNMRAAEANVVANVTTASEDQEIPGPKAPGTRLRFGDLQPGDVLEVKLKEVDVAQRHVRVTPLKRTFVAPRLTTSKAQRAVFYW